MMKALYRRDLRMWDSYQLVGHAVRAWVYQGLYGLSGVGNILGGVWVVLKLEWQPLHQGAPPVKFCRVRSSFGPASFSHFPHFLALVAARRISASRSAPSPSWPLRQFGDFLLLVRPHHHLLHFSLNDIFHLGSNMNASPTSDFL